MKPATKTLLATTSLVCAFYLSVSFRYGDPGWALEFHPRADARAETSGGQTYDLKSLAILNRAVLHIKEQYVDPTRINERRMIGGAMEEVQRAVAELLVEVDKDAEGVPNRITVRVDQAEQTFDLVEVGNLWQMVFKFKDIFAFIEENLRHHKKLQDIEYAAINGMLSTLDPHSVLLRPDDYREMKLSTRGKFGGLGIVISIREGHLTIINPIEDTPASRAGLKAGDHIVQINHDSTVNMALSDAVDMLRGEPNTQVDIWVIREGWKKSRKFTLTRDNIKVKSVTSRLLEDRVGLVRIRNFQNTTYEELRKSLDALERGAKKKLKGLVIDLRGNPGGLLDQAIKVSDLFIESGPLVTTVGYGDKMREPKMATRSGTVPNYPVVVLLSHDSASASEIVAGALKNHERAVLLGQRSFGKGSVQVIYDNKDDSALKLTIAQYLTPGDVSIQSVGVTPDIETQAVVLTDEDTRFFPDEQAQGGEKDLPSHLTNTKADQSMLQKPALVLKFLEDQKLAEKIRDNPNDIIEDFEITLARTLIASSSQGNRDGVLADARQAVERISAAERQRVVAALGERGVDWATPGAPLGTPKAHLTLKTNQPGDRVTAGDTLELTATVRNDGDGPFAQLRARSESENDYLAGHELIFGNIPPGEERSWTVKVKMPKSALTRRDAVTLRFSEAHARAVPELSMKVGVTQLPRPRFALSYRIDDTQEGNGDGLLQPGEVVELVVGAKNVGVGDGFALLGAIRNEQTDSERGLFVQRGRIRADGVKRGGQYSFRFRFKVKDEGTHSTEPLTVAVSDPELRENTTERLNLPVGVPLGAALEPVKVRLSDPKGGAVALRTLPGATAPLLGSTAGAVADARVGDWYRVPTRVGADKTYGWVDSSAVSVSSDHLERAGAAADPAEGAVPPVISLADHQLGEETADEAVTLSGEVLDEELIQDLLIYVNNKKVYFKSNQDNAAVDRMRFSARVPLDRGVNLITLIARQDDEASSRHTLIVNREK